VSALLVYAVLSRVALVAAYALAGLSTTGPRALPSGRR